MDRPLEPPPLDSLPPIDLRHLRRLTDDTGLMQHALYATPDPNHGYCIDDNARALIAGLYNAQLQGHDEAMVPLHTYLSFLTYAWNEERGRFRNFMSYDRRWLEEEGSQDSQGRAMWALGLTALLGPTEPIRRLAQDYYRRCLPALEGLGSPRSWAFGLLGLDAYLQGDPVNEEVRRRRDGLAEAMLEAYRRGAEDDWPWWEREVTYDNAKLPHALMLSGSAMGRPEMVEVGLSTLRWLLEQQTEVSAEGRAHLSIIGNDGWLPRGGERAKFDQQPLEAYAMLDACLAAARLDPDRGAAPRWEADARMCYEWFTGRNDLDLAMFDPATGGSCDGLHPGGTNQNQGAESSLAYLLCVLELHRYAADVRPAQPLQSC